MFGDSDEFEGGSEENLEENPLSEEEGEQEQEIPESSYLKEPDVYEIVPFDKKRNPVFIFCEIDDLAFLDVSKVYRDQFREMKFFSKLEHHYPVSHFLDKPERPKYVYEKQYWSFTLFDRFVERMKHTFSPLSSAPFTLSGDCDYFERQTLYSPQSCPVYVLKSRDLMVNNLKRFARITAVLSRDEYDEESFDGDFPDDCGLEIKKFLKKRGESKTVRDDSALLPSVDIDRNSIPSSIANF